MAAPQLPLPESRSDMTLPLVTLPGTGAGQPPPPGPVLILTCRPGLALATLELDRRSGFDLRQRSL
jgi:hypothetical protein